MYGANVVSRLRPAGSVGECSHPSVTKTASGGVFSAIHSAASSWERFSTW
jgi:hypothetical protein